MQTGQGMLLRKHIPQTDLGCKCAATSSVGTRMQETGQTWGSLLGVRSDSITSFKAPSLWASNIRFAFSSAICSAMA